MFTAQVSAHPDAEAVRCGSVVLSYAELDEQANRLAHWLIGIGVGPERLVAVALTRSVDLVVALLAVAKAGGGYLPIDPNYPAQRIAFMLTDAAPVVVLTSTTTTTQIPATPARPGSSSTTRQRAARWPPCPPTAPPTPTGTPL